MRRWALLVCLPIAACGLGRDRPLPRLARPHQGVQLVVGPFHVPEGQEAQLCFAFRLPSDVDLDIERIEIAATGGSHHLHLYQAESFDRGEGIYECFDAVDFDRWKLVVATQATRTDWRLPAGVAYRLRANQPLLVQSHYVNVGRLLTEENTGYAVLNLHAAAPGTVTTWAGSVFAQNRDIAIPPRSQMRFSAHCTWDRDVKFFAMTGHFHFHGVRFMVNLWEGDRMGPEIYRSEDFDEPKFKVWPDHAPIAVPRGHGIAWTCDYQNRLDQTLWFGPRETDQEHCNLFAFYHPAAGPQETTYCVWQDGRERVQH